MLRGNWSMEREVRTFIINESGEFEAETIMPLSTYGECPQVGDTIVNHSGAGENISYIVENRFFFHLPDVDGWALIVKRVDDLETASKISRAWREDDKLWAEVHASDPDEQNG